jgi:hypothetical protein
MTETMPTTSTTQTARPHHLPPAEEGRGWVLAGLGAAIAGTVGVVASAMSGAVYEEELAGDALGITERLAEQTGSILVFHCASMVAALLLLVFAAGLRRRIAARTPEGHLAAQVAAAGLMLVSVTLVMGSSLTTEFVFGVQEPALLVPETAVFFGHWIGTVPWVWAGAGVAALALGVAGWRHSAVPPWLTWVSLVLGGLTTLIALSPLQYLAGMTGPLWLLVTTLGLLRRA